MDAPVENEIKPAIPATQRTETPGVVAVDPHCPKCTGPMVRCAVGYVGIYGWWLERTTRPAGALGPSRSSTSDLVADTCIRCGYTEFFAKDPAALMAGEDKH